MSSLYENLLRKVLFPAWESGLRRRKTLAWLAAYERDQWLSGAEIARLQFQRLKRLLEHCEREVPYYRQRWHEAGIKVADIANLEDFAELPILEKADIREHLADLTARSWQERMLYKATGGSTGEPLRFGYTRESHDRRTAVMLRGYRWAGSRLGRRTLFLWGGAVGNPNRRHEAKDWLYNRLLGRHVLDSFHMTEANMATYADAVDRVRPKVIVTYVGPLVRLAQWLEDNGRKVHRPDSIITAAEPLHAFQRELLERAFGCPVFNTYGCREFMLIAAECEQHAGLHINADHLVVELAGAVQSGQRGEVLVTDLFNYGMPFIRYRNGDMAVARDGACACGRGLPMLESIEGRRLDAIRTPDGHVLPGEFFPHMLKDVKGVRRFQLVQEELDRLDLAIVPNEGFNAADEAYIRREVAKVAGEQVQLDIRLVDDIPLTRSGKLRVTLSRLAE